MACKTLLPTHINAQINELDLLGCERLQGFREAADTLPTLYNPAEIDPRYLATMVDEYEAVAFYDFEEDMRALIGYAQRHYPKMGTVAAVKEVFAALDIEATIVEWYESGKAPYLFDIDLSLTDREITPELAASLRRLVVFTKNARSHLDEFILSYYARQTIDIHSGMVVELESRAEMIDGYTFTHPFLLQFHAGVVVESEAIMKGGTQ